MIQMTFGEQNTEKEAHEMLSYAFERGINILDTSEAVSLFTSYLYTHMYTCIDAHVPAETQTTSLTPAENLKVYINGKNS